MLKKKFLLIYLLIMLLLMLSCSKPQQEPTINVKLVNEKVEKMKIEKYIQGVVAGEMKKAWPKNSYAAQAIIARTFTLKRLEENGNNTISSEHKEAQAYKPENITQEIKEAVNMTRGEVVTYQRDYIQGWFHSSAGGQTTSARVGLAYKKEEPPYIQSVKSPDDAAPSDVQNWESTVFEKEIVKVLQTTGEAANNIKDIKILNKDDTGRVVDFEIFYDQGSKKIAGAEFRTLIGPDSLKSTLINSIIKLENKFIFKGSGYGHGVGMSQWGAYKMGKQGKKPEEIIKYYFKDVEIEKKWE